MDLEKVSYLAYALRGKRAVVQDLHGPWDGEGPVWPTPYAHGYDTRGFWEALDALESRAPTALWEHGRLCAVADEETLETLGETWEAWRLEGARVGPLDATSVSSRDLELIRAFCGRGWLRLLVRAFFHVGCKAAHVGALGAEGMEPFGSLGVAVEASRGRPRLAVLEEILRDGEHSEGSLLGALDDMDRRLDAMGMGSSWGMAQVPDHVLSLWPMRNLLRMADRMGALFRHQEWKDYEGSNVYAPEVPMLVVEEDIYGGGVEHDVTHFVSPVLWTEDQLCFEIGNNGIEGDGQAMNNLILASRHEGPAYEGFAGWPGADLFEWLERSYGAASVPEQIAALRMFTIVLHRQFRGDPLEVLARMAPSLRVGSEIKDLLHFYPEYIQHDHDFLGELHPRYVTPFYRKWKDVLGDRVVEDPYELVDTANDLLWALEDLDLRSWDHLCRGEASHLVQRQQLVLTKCLELHHLWELAAVEGEETLWAKLEESVAKGLADRQGIRDWSDDLQAALAQSAGCETPAGLPEQVHEWGRRMGAYEREVAQLAADTQVAQRSWANDLPRVADDFIRDAGELFEGYYFKSPVHIGSDVSEPQRLKGCYSGA